MTFIDRATVETFRAGATWLGGTIDLTDETGSTNDDAFRAAGQGALSGHVVVADRQSAGRGSHGREWVSPPGEDLYFSFVVLPKTTLDRLSTLTLAVGLGVADAVEQSLVEQSLCTANTPNPGTPSVTIKWPNDVWIDRHKAGGILVESRVREERAAVVVGVGLNVNRTDFGDVADATSLCAASGRTFDRAKVLGRALRSIEAWVDRWEKDGAAPIVAALKDRLALIHERVRIDDREVTIAGVDPSGALLVRDTAGTLQALHAGRVQPVR